MRSEIVQTAQPLPRTACAVSPLPAHVEGSLLMTGVGSFPSLQAGREGSAKAAEGWGFAEMKIMLSTLVNQSLEWVLLETLGTTWSHKTADERR